MHAAAVELPGLVNQQNRVVDHDAAQHDAADVRLHVERGAGQKQRDQHSDDGQRHGEHHHQGVAQRFVLAGQHHVNEHQCQDERDDQFVEGFLLFFVIAGHDQVIADGPCDGRQAVLDIPGHRTHVAAGHVGVDRDQALLVLAVDHGRPETGFGRHQVAQGDVVARGRGQGQV